jgi:hypothetical protein
MTPDQFWGLIQFAGARCRENETNIEEEIERELVRIPPDEIVSFDGLLQAYLRVATECVVLRAEAHVCDGFHHLLVARGREVFLAAVADPEAAVAGYEGKDGPEDFLHVAYFKRTGRNLGRWDVRWSEGDYCCQYY